MARLLDIARAEIGYSRYTDPEQGTKYGRWYAEQTGIPYYGQNGVPYCAMFVSWCAAQAGISLDGGIFAYCPSGETAMRKAGREVPFTAASAGDIVFYDWDGDGIADHVGIVAQRVGHTLVTIEGNTSAGAGGSQTNGGRVAQRTRDRQLVSSIMRPEQASTGNNNETRQEQENNKMVFAFRPNNEGRLIFFDGSHAHDLRHEDELEVIKRLYYSLYGRDLPLIELGSESAPWASRFLDIIARGVTNKTPILD